jgi:LmbE family N-acetylglucosaminyl deacetylase
VRPGLFVDVETVLELKTAMLGCHRSQQRWLDSSQGLPSYIVTMHELMAEVGRLSGRYRVAEGWRRHLHYGFCTADADPLVQALGPHVLVESRR